VTRILTIAGIVWKEMIRRKDVYVLLILLGALLFVLVSLDIFGLGGLVTYVKDVGFLLAWVFAWILAVTVSCRELPQEEAQGTIYSLLAKPISRAELIAGKWLGTWSMVVVATLVFYGVVVGLTAARGGQTGGTVLAQGVVLHSACLGVVASIGILFSTRMNRDAATSLTYVLTAVSFLVLPRIPEFMAHETGLRAGALLFLYNALPHFEVFDLRRRIVHNYSPADVRVFLGILGYGCLLTALFLFWAWLAYRKKRFARGALS